MSGADHDFPAYDPSGDYVSRRESIDASREQTARLARLEMARILQRNEISRLRDENKHLKAMIAELEAAE